MSNEETKKPKKPKKRKKRKELTEDVRLSLYESGADKTDGEVVKRGAQRILAFALEELTPTNSLRTQVIDGNVMLCSSIKSPAGNQISFYNPLPAVENELKRNIVVAELMATSATTGTPEGWLNAAFQQTYNFTKELLRQYPGNARDMLTENVDWTQGEIVLTDVRRLETMLGVPRRKPKTLRTKMVDEIGKRRLARKKREMELGVGNNPELTPDEEIAALEHYDDTRKLCMKLKAKYEQKRIEYEDTPEVKRKGSKSEGRRQVWSTVLDDFRSEIDELGIEPDFEDFDGDKPPKPSQFAYKYTAGAFGVAVKQVRQSFKV